MLRECQRRAWSDDADIDYSDFFISNDLTCHKKFLVRRARRAKRNENIHDCWFYDGQIIIKHLSIKIMLINWKKNLDGIDPMTEVV